MRQFAAVLWAGVFAALALTGQGSGARSLPAGHSPYGEAPSLPAQVPLRPRAGAVEIMKSSEVKPGMRGVAWTVF